MDRAEAEAIYDSGREACVLFIVDLASRVQQLDERLVSATGGAGPPGLTDELQAAVDGSTQDAR